MIKNGRAEAGRSVCACGRKPKVDGTGKASCGCALDAESGSKSASGTRSDLVVRALGVPDHVTR